jgi:hypothetical protein
MFGSYIYRDSFINTFFDLKIHEVARRIVRFPFAFTAIDLLQFVDCKPRFTKTMCK